MRAQEAVLFNGTGSGFTGTPTASFKLLGGRYVVCMVGTSGTLSLKILGPDGSTYIICKDIAGNAVTNGSLATASFNTVDLPPGQYEFDGTSPVAAYAEIVRCPGD
jgi:hypothetical protein